MTPQDNQSRDREQGMSMIELIIGMGIGVIVAVLAVMVLRTTIQTQGVVTSSTAAATRAQGIADLIDAAVRQSVGSPGIKVSPDSTRLDVRLAGACQTFWVYGDDLYGKKSTAEATGSTLDSSWTKLLSWGSASGVATLKTVPVANPSTGASLPYFVATNGGSGVTYSFRLTGANANVSGTSRNVDVVSTAVQRAPGSGGLACF